MSVAQECPSNQSGWHSALLQTHGVAHWFSTRDSPSDLWIAQHLAGRCAQAVRVRQVHGARWLSAQECLRQIEDADAIISNAPLLVPVIATADCCPVLVACLSSKSCAAIHAGWRGIALDIVGSSVRAMCERFGADPRQMVCAIGPCASGERYEVGTDVIDAFSRCDLNRAILPSPLPGKAFADCAAATRILLERAGIPSECIDANPPCTIGDTRFASHRREPQNKLRMLAGIASPA